MKPCIKKILVVVAAMSVFTGMSSLINNAWSALSPYVSVLPSVYDGIGLPVRITPDIDAAGSPTGFFYVTDQRSGGILKYNSDGKLQMVITTVPNGTGLAVTKSGKLLVAQGTSVAVLDKTRSFELNPPTFGTFTQAHGIAIDGSGNIYVTDSIANNIQVFNSAFVYVTTLGSKGNYSGQFIRPTGITYEKKSGYLAVCDTLNGRINFINAAGATQYSIPPDVGGKAAGIGTGFGRFTALKGVTFEYALDGSVSRIYAVDTYQSGVQVFDGTTRAFLSAFGVGTNDSSTNPVNNPFIGSYGFLPGNLITPFDVYFDGRNTLSPRLLVTNGIGALSVFGVDSLEPSDVIVKDPTVFKELTLTWTNPPASSGFNHINIYRSTVAGQLGSLITGAGGITGTTYTNVGLADNTKYYYTVRAVNGQLNETTGTLQASGTTKGQFLLTTNIVGSGQVTGNSNPVLSCTTALCNNLVDSGTFTLIATPGSDSVFKGWSGACTNLSGNCLVKMDAAKTVTATFELQHMFKVDGYYFDTLQDAYDAAPDDVKIMSLSGTVPVAAIALSAENGITVTVEGGYDVGYVNTTLETVIQGPVNISAGKVIFNKIKIR